MPSLLLCLLIVFSISSFSILDYSDSEEAPPTLIRMPIPEQFPEKKVLTSTDSIAPKKAQRTSGEKLVSEQEFSKLVSHSPPHITAEPAALLQPTQTVREEKNHVSMEPTKQSSSQALKDRKSLPNSMKQPQQKDDNQDLNLIHKERILLYPYSIDLGSYKSLRRAQKALSNYQKKGLSPYWVQVDLGSQGAWYRIFAGYFQKRDDAEAFIKENNLVDAKSRHTKFANLIGVYQSKKELDTKRRFLLGLGYYPYVIQENQNRHFLYTGAFYRKDRAEKEHKALASEGIENQLAERWAFLP
jgi:cell division septation protein DedD